MAYENPMTHKITSSANECEDVNLSIGDIPHVGTIRFMFIGDEQ